VKGEQRRVQKGKTKLTREQRTTYHEAAHAVAAIHIDERFAHIALARGPVHDARLLEGMIRALQLRPFIRKRWKEVVKLGNALVLAPDQTLTSEQCRAVLGVDVEALAA
jgi:hypothetical protein